MKQAVLITCYKDFEQLFDIINYFDNDFLFYIHIDKKSKIDASVLHKLNSLPNVVISRKYKVNWAGRNHLLAILHLSKIALANESVFYFHFITGQDFPIKSVDEFKTYFSKNQSKSFIQNFSIPADFWKNGGFDRIQYYSLYDVFDYFKNKNIINFLIRLQKKMGFKRALPSNYKSLYGGSAYWSLSREALAYVVFIEDRGFLKRLRHTYAAAEMYFQTLLCNSPLKLSLVSNNLRYINWNNIKGGSPHRLTEKDYYLIDESDAFFARKFHIHDSENLRKKILCEIQ
jgi:Core-2/I-Branching enzyme